jgi:hypothetical protein
MPVETEQPEMCKYNKCDLQHDPCLLCLKDYIKDDIYERIADEHEGEITKEEFNEMVGDIVHEEIDDAVNRMSMLDAERLVGEFGLVQTIQLYTNTFGMWQETPTLKAFLYCIIDETLDYCYYCYIRWNNTQNE